MGDKASQQLYTTSFSGSLTCDLYHTQLLRCDLWMILVSVQLPLYTFPPKEIDKHISPRFSVPGHVFYISVEQTFH